MEELKTGKENELLQVNESKQMLLRQLQEERETILRIKEQHQRDLQALREEHSRQLLLQKEQFDALLNQKIMEYNERMEQFQVEKKEAIYAEHTLYEERLQQVTNSLQITNEQINKRLDECNVLVKVKEESMMGLDKEMREYKTLLEDCRVKTDMLSSELELHDMNAEKAILQKEKELFDCRTSLQREKESVSNLEGIVQSTSADLRTANQAISGLQTMVENQKVLNMGVKECMITYKYFHTAMEETIMEAQKKEEQSPIPDPLKEEVNDPLMECLLKTKDSSPDVVIKLQKSSMEPKSYTVLVIVMAVIMVFMLMLCCSKCRIPSQSPYES